MLTVECNDSNLPLSKHYLNNHYDVIDGKIGTHSIDAK